MVIDKIWEWIKERGAIDNIPLKRVPYNHFNLGAWLGAVVVGSFALLAITGLLLLFYYDTGNPSLTNQKLLEEKPYFNLILTLHLYSAHAMLLSAAIHMLRNFYLKIYGKPRELLWILGVITGFMALQTAFFGYSLVGDTTAFEAVQIGKGLVSSSLGDWLGKTLGALAFGVEGIEFKRVLGLHIMMATLVGALFLAHFGLFEGLGPFLNRKEKKTNKEELAPWFPVNFLYMGALILGVWGIIALVNALSQAAGFVNRLIYPLPIFEGSSIAEQVRPMPPWFLLFAFKLFQLDFLYINIPGYTALPILVISMVLPPLVLMALPFIDRTKSQDPLKRYLATSIALYFITILATLTVWGAATLGYTSKAMATSIFLAPALVVFLGLKVLSSNGEKSLSHYSMFQLSAIIIISAFIPLIAAITTKASAADLAAEAMTALFGVAFATLLIYLAYWYSGRLRDTVEARSSPDGEKNIGTEVPSFFLYAGVASTLIIAIAAALLGYSGISAIEIVKPTNLEPPPQLDPLNNPAGIAALTATIFLGMYSLLYTIYRAYVIDKTPYQGGIKESLPHIPTIISLLIAIMLIF